MKKDNFNKGKLAVIFSLLGTFSILVFYLYIILTSSSYENNRTADLSNNLSWYGAFVVIPSIIAAFLVSGRKRIIPIVCTVLSLILLGLTAFAASFSHLGSS